MKHAKLILEEDVIYMPYVYRLPIWSRELTESTWVWI